MFRWAVAAASVLALGSWGCPPKAPPAPQEVSGTLIAELSERVPGKPAIELPESRVFLRDSGSQQEVASTKTQLDGKFYLLAGPGSYLLCWEMTALTGCGPKVVVKDAPVWLNTVGVSVDTTFVYGTVLTGDDRPCWLHDEFFALNVVTKLRLIEPSTGNPARDGDVANFQGEYFLPGIEPGRYVIEASCEQADANARVSLGGVPVEVNLALPNHAPRVRAVEARESGNGVTRVAAGAQVTVDALAHDADSDPIDYRWRALDGSGSIAGGSTATQNWILPSTPGLHSLYLLARDGKGGYAYQRFDLQVGPPNLGFSGRVIDEFTKAPVEGVSVEANGVATTTNAQGWFSVIVPPAPSRRYVLNMRHPEYALLSRVFDRSAEGNTYELIGVETTTHDLAAPIDVVDNGGTGPCGTPGGREQRPPRVLSQPETESDRPPDREPCRHVGAGVRMRGGAFEIVGGGAPRAPISMALATHNPARRAIPGDYRANDPALGPSEMLSFGALYANFRDADGKPLNLRSGQTAEVRVPVSPQQQPAAQPTIDLWYYDESAGFWEKEGTATLVSTPQGPMYIGRTTHFSTINMDVAGNDPAQATCVRMEIDSSLSAWQNLVLRAYVSYGGTSVQVKETPLDGAQYHAIYRIPFGTGSLNTLRLELRGTFNSQEVVLLNNIINTDARPKMTGTNLWPPYPYSECGDPIVLTADPIALPYYGDIDATGRPAFLTGPYGQFLPPDGEQVATDYYAAIDPTNAKDTLGEWWSLNGFSQVDGSGGTRAAYLNHNDLGFGRDMNCLATGSDFACYVTNYGLPDQNAANANAAESRDATKRGATVAMEYKASEPLDKRVQFFVYGGGVTGSGRIKFADLDGLGPKPVPHLCLVCHGGRFDTDNKAKYARFREFDLPSFKYSEGRSWNFGQTTLSAAELASFGTLNQSVRDVSLVDVPASPIRALISNWYPGNNFATAPVQPAVPSGWSSQAAGYQEVFGQSCRTCHVARDAGAVDPFFVFNKSSEFAGTSYAVCSSPKLMPNAFVTYKNFWSDASRVLLYRTLTGATSCQ